MSTLANTRSFFVVALAATALLACEPPEGDSARDIVLVHSSALTAQDRLTACAQDPRVLTGLVSQQICAGADIFFRETFNGNGRTCGTCHPAENNTTVDAPFTSNLNATKPNDPLFVFRTNPDLAQLEIGDNLLQNAVI